MIKLVASDLDGTLLLDGAQSLRPETCGLIHRLHEEKGILVLAASGRQYGNLRNLFAPVADEISYICENGCLSFYWDELIHRCRLDRETGQAIMRGIEETDGAEILLSGIYTSYMQPKEMSFYYHMRDVVKNHVTLVEDIYATEEPYFKISVYEKDGVEHHADFWKEKFQDLANVVVSGNCWVDMMPKGIDKGYGMEQLLKYLGIAPDECAAFGDNYNDREMLAYVGKPVAMDSAVAEIYQMCSCHTDTVEHGLQKILDGKW